MRRALLLATLLAAPSLASAQATGAVTLEHGTGRGKPLTVNATECQGGATALARWTPTMVGVYAGQPIPTSPTYAIYGSNTDPLSTSNPTANTCFTSPDTSNGRNIQAGAVLTGVSASNATIDLGVLIQAAAKSCANEADTVWICVQGKDQAGVIFGIATAAVTISTRYPAVPTINALRPGNRALNIDWGGGELVGTLVDTFNVEFEATPVSSTGELGAPLVAGRFGASPARFEKLVNDQGYLVRARAFTDADNASTLSDPAVLGTPVLTNDFWAEYQSSGGRDAGGCSSGLAGPLGLGILVATLALSRRRK